MTLLIVLGSVAAYFIGGLLSARAWWIHMHRVWRSKTRHWEWDRWGHKVWVDGPTSSLQKLYSRPNTRTFWVGAMWPLFWSAWLPTKGFQLARKKAAPTWNSFWKAFFSDPKHKEQMR